MKTLRLFLPLALLTGRGQNIARVSLGVISRGTTRLKRFNLVRFILNLWTFRMPVWVAGQAPILLPETHQIWDLEKITSCEILLAVAKAYVSVFSEKPWCEHYESGWVVEKLQRELKNSASLLVTLAGNEIWPVVGFCWGVVASPCEIYQRILEARSMGTDETAKEELAHLLLNGSLKLDPRLLFVDEVAILRAFRGGLSPIQFLIRPIFEMGYQAGVHQALFWTSRASPIYPLAVAMGFESVGEVDGIEYMFHPNLVPLLKILQNVEPERIRMILGITSGSFLRFLRVLVQRKLRRQLKRLKSQADLVLR